MKGVRGDLIAYATYDPQFSGVHISRVFADKIRKCLPNSNTEILWFEAERSSSHRDIFKIYDRLQCDMVIGRDRGLDIERGRSSIIAPISRKYSKGEYPRLCSWQLSNSW